MREFAQKCNGREVLTKVWNPRPLNLQFRLTSGAIGLYFVMGDIIRKFSARMQVGLLVSNCSSLLFKTTWTVLSMSETHESLLNLINASGFLLQLRIEHEIESTQREHNWQIVGREHYWKDPDSGDDGFIDIVLQSETLRVIVECKRVLDGSWVFLLPDSPKANLRRARLYWTDTQVDRQNIYGWCDFCLTPDFPESAFCVIRGQGEKDKPMLERLSGIVLKSLESLAEEEMRLTQLGRHRIYIPVIVTTASLEVCKFDVSKVSLQTGQLQLPDGQFETVPFIAFRKGLATKYLPERLLPDLRTANQEKERTIFVVQATELLSFLKHLPNLKMFDEYEAFPWRAAREQEIRRAMLSGSS